MSAAIGVKVPLPGVVYAPERELRLYIEAGLLGRQTLQEAFWEPFQKHAGRVAGCDRGGERTYAELDALTDRAGAALLRLGLRPLDRVVFQISNSNELLIAFIGCLKAGLIPICTLAAHRAHEIGYIARHAQARGHIVQGDDAKFDLVSFAAEMKSEIPSMHVVVSTRGAARAGIARLEDLIAREEPAAARDRLEALPRDPFQAAVFQLSGGTTGVPKLIPRFHNEYVYNMLAVASYLEYRLDDVMLMPLPMVHNASLSCAWGPVLLVGGAFAIVPQPTTEVFVELLRKYKPTWIAAGLKQALLKIDDAARSVSGAFERVRGVWTIESARYTREIIGLPGFHIFGMAEGLIMFTRGSDPLDAREQSVGRPICEFDRLRILKPGTEQDLPPGEIGELAVKGPYTIHGYYDAPERNAQAFTSDGFYRPGDLMSAREYDGKTYYAFEGRIKDVVDRGGEKVNCEELELALAGHASIADVAVVGMPDPGLGERICAYVVLRRGALPADVTVSALAGYMRERGFAKFKWPERVEVVDDMPATKVGKIDKAQLRRMIAEKLVVEGASAKH